MNRPARGGGSSIGGSGERLRGVLERAAVRLRERTPRVSELCRGGTVQEIWGGTVQAIWGGTVPPKASIGKDAIMPPDWK